MLLEQALLTESGRPVLHRGEVELFMVDTVDLQFTNGPGGVEGHLKDKHEDGHMILTTHRLVWIDAAAAPAAGATCALPLSTVRDVRLKATHLWSSTKIRISVHVDENRRPTARPQGGRVSELRILAKQQAALVEQMQNALAQKAWERAHPGAEQSPLAWLNSPSPSPSFSPMGQSLSQRVDNRLLEELSNMGFPRLAVAHALMATENQGADQAISWIFAHEGHPVLTQPLPVGGGGPPAPPEPVSTFSTASAGVAGILRREQELAASAERTMEDAFRDLKGLMTKAGEMVQLAQRFRGALGDSSSDSLDPDLANELISMGIESPVTRETAGALFHQQLSRQLADFLRVQIDKAGGLMPLPDVYCLFNRARGVELVSPDDLLAAARLFPKINVPLSLRQFASGVLVVQSASHTDAQVCARIKDLLGQPQGLGPPLSATDIAAALSVPIAIAGEHLLTAENAGLLCRDDGPEGVRFFRNFFREVDACA